MGISSPLQIPIEINSFVREAISESTIRGAEKSGLSNGLESSLWLSNSNESYDMGQFSTNIF